MKPAGKSGSIRVLPSTLTSFSMQIMDVIKIEKSGDTFRLMYDTKGRFVVHRRRVVLLLRHLER